MTLTYNGDKEEWRYTRLAQVAQIMCILDPELQDSISNLHYHESCLTVTWMASEAMSEEGKSMLKGIWELLNESLIEHEICES